MILRVTPPSFTQSPPLTIVPLQHIFIISLMVSRGTWGPPPHTEMIHRPTGKADHSPETNIKSEIHTHTHTLVVGFYRHILPSP